MTIESPENAEDVSAQGEETAAATPQFKVNAKAASIN